MIETKYVEVKIRGMFKNKPEKLQSVIEEYAQQGYRLSACIPVQYKWGMYWEKVGLIFQK